MALDCKKKTIFNKLSVIQECTCFTYIRLYTYTKQSYYKNICIFTTCQSRHIGLGGRIVSNKLLLLMLAYIAYKLGLLEYNNNNVFIEGKPCTDIQRLGVLFWFLNVINCILCFEWYSLKYITACVV